MVQKKIIGRFGTGTVVFLSAKKIEESNRSRLAISPKTKLGLSGPKMIKTPHKRRCININIVWIASQLVS
jgi:hypothetical protein